MQTLSKAASALTKVNSNSQVSRTSHTTNQRLSLPSVHAADNSTLDHDNSHYLTYVQNSENYKVSHT